MAFHGEQLDNCKRLTFSSAACIIVTGDAPNLCGHALLYADGHYFHVAGAVSRPFHLDELGYRRYLTESGKTELGRYRRYLKLPNAAYAKLMILLSKPWFWGILPHNCLVFVEEVLQAGGATNFGLFSNCPVLQKNHDQWEKMIHQMRRSANEMAIRQYMLGRSPF